MYLINHEDTLINYIHELSYKHEIIFLLSVVMYAAIEILEMSHI